MNTSGLLNADETAKLLGINRRTLFRWLNAGVPRPTDRRQRGRKLWFEGQAVKALRTRIDADISPRQAVQLASVENLAQMLERCDQASALTMRAKNLVLDAAEILFKSTGDTKARELLVQYGRLRAIRKTKFQLEGGEI